MMHTVYLINDGMYDYERAPFDGCHVCSSVAAMQHARHLQTRHLQRAHERMMVMLQLSVMD